MCEYVNMCEYVDSVNEFQKEFARFSIAFAGFLWIIMSFWPKASFLMIVKHFSKCREISGFSF